MADKRGVVNPVVGGSSPPATANFLSDLAGLVELDQMDSSAQSCGMSDPKVWQLHEAKARFSELFRRVRSDGPRRVVKQRGEAVVIVSAEEYDRSGELDHAQQRTTSNF